VTKRGVVTAFLTLICLALPAFTQNSKTVTKGPIVIQEFKHDTGPLLREIAPLLPEYSMPSEHEIENNANPNHPWSNEVRPDPVFQRPENSPTTQSPAPGLEFDALGFGDQFFCNCMPPDNDGAAGTTQYVQYINTLYAVFSKTGSIVLGPLSGNSFWSGFGGSCQTDNSGDPIIRFDAAAQRWVASQFAINNSGNDFECVAVSQTADATGAYNRYAFSFANFPDYPKMGIWPDAYYFTFNNFNLAGTAFVGANVCAADRTKMLAGATATIQCFQQNSQQFGMLPSDLDGPTPPAAGTPNFFMELDPSGSANLDMFAFHVDFTTPSNSTFTGPTKIPVAAFTPLCNTQTRGRCVRQPTAGSDLLESLGDRLMYRLVYRNFGDHTVLLASHSIVAGSSGGLRWYEIHNPETGPTVFQSGTFAPDTQFRWMPAIAMDHNQDIAVGFSRSGTASGQFPSLVYAGRVPGDAAGTLESEVTLLTGLGSQTGGGDRWGDYTSLTVDPTDDCTFWFTEEYQKQTGGFDWSTAVGTFVFPGCGGGGSPDFSLSANPTSVTVAQGGMGTSAITITPIDGFAGSVTLSASPLPSGVTANFNPNPATTSSTLTFTANGTATTGTSTVTVTGISGSLTHTTNISLTVTGSGGGGTVSLSPTSLTFANVVVGATSSGKNILLTNTGTSTVNISSITASGDFHLITSAKPCGSTLAVGKNCKIDVTFSPTQTGTRTGTVTITDNASGSPQTVPLTGTGTVQATLTPTSKTFPATTVGSSSAAKTFTLTNKQNVALTGISSVGTGDFHVSGTTCGSSLGAKAKCTISVVFTPTATGTRTGQLQVSDSAAGSPQTSSLTGTGK
jgi:hypothetical protein